MLIEVSKSRFSQAFIHSNLQSQIRIADDVVVTDTDRTTKTDCEAYGTQKQTVILVDRKGTATYVEKTLYDDHGRPTDDDVQQYEFEIEGWNE